jgi:hypothetical protein
MRKTMRKTIKKGGSIAEKYFYDPNKTYTDKEIDELFKETGCKPFELIPIKRKNDFEKGNFTLHFLIKNMDKKEEFETKNSFDTIHTTEIDGKKYYKWIIIDNILNNNEIINYDDTYNIKEIKNGENEIATFRPLNGQDEIKGVYEYFYPPSRSSFSEIKPISSIKPRESLNELKTPLVPTGKVIRNNKNQGML